MKWGTDYFDFYYEEKVKSRMNGIDIHEWRVKVAFNIGFFKIYIYAIDPDFDRILCCVSQAKAISKYLEKVYKIKTIKHGR